MHDGVFRIRNLTAEERRLAKTVDNYDCHTDENRQDAVWNLMAKRCQLPRWLLPDAIPNDMFAREYLLRRIQDESVSPFVDAVGEALEQSQWDLGCYLRALEDAVAQAMGAELDSASRHLRANISDEKPNAAAKVRWRLRQTTEGFAGDGVASMASEVARHGRAGMRKKTFDVDGEIPGVDYSAA
jgi:hypothetical protein